MIKKKIIAFDFALIAGIAILLVLGTAFQEVKSTAGGIRFGTNLTTSSSGVNDLIIQDNVTGNNFAWCLTGCTGGGGVQLIGAHPTGCCVIFGDANASVQINSGVEIDFKTSSVSRVQLTTAAVQPNSDNGMALGGSSNHWTSLALTICQSSGGTCGAATSGSVSIAAAATTVTVATTAVTANSLIIITEDSTRGGVLSVTCNTTTGRTYSVTTRTAGTSFVITASAAPAANPACLNFMLVN